MAVPEAIAYSEVEEPKDTIAYCNHFRKKKTFKSWWNVWAAGRTPEDDASALVEEIKLINEIDF